MTYDVKRLAGSLSSALALTCVGGCTGGPPVPLLALGPRGDSVSATAPGVFYVPASVDDSAGAEVVVDTGSPIALLNPNSFGGHVPDGAGQVALMTLGKTTLWKVPTVGIKSDLELA